jgi:RNA polymerase sigma factor (sigma-70 family)
MRDGEGGRRRRFDALFTSYSPDILAYCGWRADSASDAQDAMAEVFLTAWRRLDELPEGDAARVWLYATARRVIANQRRSSRRRVALYQRLALDAATAVRQPPSSDREEALVHEALRRLGPRDREVLLLVEWEGLAPRRSPPSWVASPSPRGGDCTARGDDSAPSSRTCSPATAYS